MDDQTRSLISTEEASTNFYWTFGNDEIFNLQTTIRGCPIGDQIRSHITSAKTAMKAIVDAGGHAKQVGHQPKEQSAPPAQNGNNSNGGPEWTTRKDGKLVLILHGNESEPNEIACPNHGGQKFKRRTNDRGAWLSHKLGDGYCSANFERT